MINIFIVNLEEQPRVFHAPARTLGQTSERLIGESSANF